MNYVDNTIDKVDKTLVHYMLTSLTYSSCLTYSSVLALTFLLVMKLIQ